MLHRQHARRQRVLGVIRPHRNSTAPGAFAQLASAYAAKHGVDMKDLKRAMAHVSVKSHDNAALNPKAHLRSRITEEDVLKAATIAAPLGLYDCCGVSDGAACAWVSVGRTWPSATCARVSR